MQGDTLAAGCVDHKVWLWSLSSLTCTRKLSGHTYWVGSVRLLGGLLVSGSGDSTARVWSVESGECVATLTCGYGMVCGLAIAARVHRDRIIQQQARRLAAAVTGGARVVRASPRTAWTL